MIAGFGAQMFTVRDFAKTPEQIAAAFEKIAEIGYKSVQVSGIGEIAPERLRDISKRTGLVIGLTHTPYARLRDDLEQVMRDHETFGCRVVGIGGIPGEYPRTAQGIDAFIKDCSPIVRRLHENGFTFAYHNHAIEFTKDGGATLMSRLLANTDPEAFKLTADVYWIQFGGADPVSFIQDNGSRIAALHLKDMAATPENGNEMAPVGSGNLDWNRIIGAARSASVPWYMVEQDICRGDPFDALAQSYEYIRGSGLLD